MDPDSPSGSGGAPEAPPPPSSTTPPPSQPEASTGVTLAVAPPPPPPPPPTSDQVLSTPSARATKRDDASASSAPAPLSRYESQKRRDWNTFLQYLKNHKPPLALARCSGAHVIEFLKYLDQFGKTKVHVSGCDFFGHPSPPAPCACPLRQAWGSLDALIGRLRAAFEENGGRPESNPFGARAVRIYLREVRESQAKARGIPYEKKKRKRLPPPTAAATGTAQVSGSTSTVAPTSSSGGGGDVGAAGSVAAATSSSS